MSTITDKDLYETLSAIADKLPEVEREMFARTIRHLAADWSLRPLGVVNRWLKDMKY